MRVLIATGIYPPDIGGPATYSSLLAQELPKRRFEVGVLAFTKYRKMPKIIRHLAYFWRCWRLARKYDVIYSQDPVSVGLPAMLAAKLSSRKFIIRVAGDYAWEQAVQRFGVKDGIDKFQDEKYNWRTELLRKIQKFVVGKADLVITPSQYFSKLVSKWIKHPERVHTIYNGIKLIDAKNKNMNDVRKEKIIVSAGRLVPWKGFGALVEIMEELPDWRLVIIGDGPEKKNLESMIQNLELERKVKLTGAISREELLEYLCEASLFILNTAFESFSFQVVEAMNAGVPVITTNIGNLAEIIENNKEGILIEPNNKPQILSAIKRIEENNNFRDAIIRNAKQKAQQFSIENTLDNLEKLLKNL